MAEEVLPGLPSGSLVLLDSSALIYLVGSGRPEDAAATRRGAVTRAFLDAAARKELRLAASCLAWTEVVAGLLAAGDMAAADRARSLLADSDRIVLEPADVAVADAAARLLAASARSGGERLALADAIHLATALVIGADAALTNDEAWRIHARLAPAAGLTGMAGAAGIAGAIGTAKATGTARATGAGRAADRGAAPGLRVLLVDELAFELEIG